MFNKFQKAFNLFRSTWAESMGWVHIVVSYIKFYVQWRIPSYCNGLVIRPSTCYLIWTREKLFLKLNCIEFKKIYIKRVTKYFCFESVNEECASLNVLKYFKNWVNFKIQFLGPPKPCLLLNYFSKQRNESQIKNFFPFCSDTVQIRRLFLKLYDILISLINTIL